MAATATKTRKTPAGQPAALTIPAKDPAKAKATKQRPARSTKDWKDEEANEQDGKSHRGYAGARLETVEQTVVGDNYSISNWGHPTWVDDDGARLSVSFWYPTQKAAIDYPDTQDELDTKIKVFKKLKVAYIGVLPGEPLRVEDARESLKEQGADIHI